ncbi:hypothetical protein DERF_004169 [Dermatophagoides farinae]|uniref:Uncharacterized protein n=1 Tax=Dermatophagoides farinae TaxID=6954 RepID=A0A922IHJ4_DERFA|nr:hypothetical protein DERF_004169 [Dermatophagoides farinae]
MARSSIENIDINLFEDDFKKIGQEFLQSVVSIFSFFTFKSPFKKQFLLMTENATYAYGQIKNKHQCQLVRESLDDCQQYNISSSSSSSIGVDIKRVFVFGRNSDCVIFITNNDHVYSYGRNNCGCLENKFDEFFVVVQQSNR